MKKTICILLILLCHFCNAQNAAQASFLTSFNFEQFTGGIILVKATLNNFPDSLNFILDTGSGGISLDSTTCVEHGLDPVPSDTTITGMGGARKVKFLFNQTLHLPGLAISGLNFHINDYSLLTSVYGERIDGVIGYGFFNRYIVRIDFDSTKIEIYRPGKIQYPKQGYLLHPLFTSIPIQSVQLTDARPIDFNFYFDTGAGICFLMSEQFAQDSAVLLSKRKPVATFAEGVGGRLQMHLTVVNKIRIGKYKFRKVPAYIYKDDYNVTSYPYIGGLIGNDLWRRFNLMINYPNREIYLTPNTHFRDAFDYAYTGVSLYYENSLIVVDNIAPGSPAEKAGLKKDDIVIGVSNNFSNNIQQYKLLLQSPHEKIRLYINRNGQLLDLILKPQSIL
ncbi:aspartyl protease family protein [Ferruginibacter albus]|uniref:aspartyl protease family protein n=1 Tax=Ferruginibacter albus TaxID=2875540 RepID=UPI001CC565EE|nr:aspartyl protease family protein [Ferruginibacter albus]UAY52152.1 aspartyl protease family protein [Ferruginibacter albus]